MPRPPHFRDPTSFESQSAVLAMALAIVAGHHDDGNGERMIRGTRRNDNDGQAARQ